MTESSPPEHAGAAVQPPSAWRYWVHDTFMGALNTGLHYGLRHVPTDLCSGFGAQMSRLSPYRFPQSEARARRLWARLRPEASDPPAVDAAMRRLWRSAARTMAEYSVLDRLWEEGRIAVEGQEHLDALVAAGRPILVASLHLGNWEVVPVTGLGLGLRGSAFYLIPENRFEHRIAVRARRRFGGRMFPATSASIWAAVRELREGRGPFVLYIDELHRGRVQAPAFGRALRAEGNIANAVRLAQLTDAAILPAYCVRQGDSARFRVVILPPVPLIERDRDGSLLANVARLNAIIEPIVAAHLDQWFYALDFEYDP